MRPAVFCLLTLAAVAFAESDEPWVEEEDLEDYSEDDTQDRRRRDTYLDYDEPETRRRREVYDEPHFRRIREAYVEDPYEEHVRDKRCDEPRRVRRSEYQRFPRQVHQYEVYEATDEASFPSPPYEEMLAASAEHYHRVYAAPGAAASARYLHPDVSDTQRPGVRPVLSNAFASPSSEFPKSVSSPVQFVATNVASVPVALADPVGPTPLAQTLSLPPLKLAGDRLYAADQAPAAGHHHAHYGGHGHSAGGGHKKHSDHHASHGGKSAKGYDSHHHSDKGGKGHKTDEHHRKEYEEAAGKKKKHRDEAGHKGGHEEEAHGSRGAHFDEKKGHKKGHKTKGYHNKYHKDEFHKEHKFYDDFHKSGEHHRFGKFHAKHASDESGKKKAHHVKAGHDFVEHGKKGYSNKGHLDADHKGHSGKHGHEEHHEKHSEHGKKGGSEGGKQWGHAQKG